MIVNKLSNCHIGFEKLSMQPLAFPGGHSAQHILTRRLTVNLPSKVVSMLPSSAQVAGARPVPLPPDPPLHVAGRQLPATCSARRGGSARRPGRAPRVTTNHRTRLFVHHRRPLINCVCMHLWDWPLIECEMFHLCLVCCVWFLIKPALCLVFDQTCIVLGLWPAGGGT